MDEWIQIGVLMDFPKQGSRVVNSPKGSIAVFRTQDDQFFALHDRCPHRGGPLSQGIVHGHRIACPLHGWVIDLETGGAVAPDQGKTACFEIKEEQGTIYLKI
jgi:nitrite reductase (NADH) small subunit